MAQSQKIAEATGPFDLKLEGIDTFEHRGTASVLFLEVPFSEPLARLKKRCPWPSLHEFHPHITLARVKHPQKFNVHRKEITKLLKNVSFTMEVQQLRLYATINGKAQAPLNDFFLQGVTE